MEVLARSGVGAIDVIDDDRVCLTNVNRQLLATTRTVGKHKVDVAEERIHSINPRCIVRKYQTFYLPDNADQFDFSHYDYVIDCIDTVTAKLDLIYRCHEMNIPLLSCMGAAYKLDATQFRVTDIFKTINDPLAKVIRKKLRKTKIKHLKVVYSPEEPLESIEQQKYLVVSTASVLIRICVSVLTVILFQALMRGYQLRLDLLQVEKL